MTVTWHTSELLIMAVGLVVALCVSFIAARFSTHALIETILQEIEKQRLKTEHPKSGDG